MKSQAHHQQKSRTSPPPTRIPQQGKPSTHQRNPASNPPLAPPPLDRTPPPKKLALLALIQRLLHALLLRRDDIVFGIAIKALRRGVIARGHVFAELGLPTRFGLQSRLRWMTKFRVAMGQFEGVAPQRGIDCHRNNLFAAVCALGTRR